MGIFLSFTPATNWNNSTINCAKGMREKEREKEREREREREKERGRELVINHERDW